MLLEAEKHGEADYPSFKTKQLESKPIVLNFHDVLPKLKLKTFSSITKQKKKVSSNGKEVILKAYREMSGHDNCLNTAL